MGGRFRKSAATGVRIKLASLNIQTGRAGGQETAIQALHQGNVDVGSLQETNLMQGIQNRHYAGYNVWATDAESRHRGE